MGEEPEMQEKRVMRRVRMTLLPASSIPAFAVRCSFSRRCLWSGSAEALCSSTSTVLHLEEIHLR